MAQLDMTGASISGAARAAALLAADAGSQVITTSHVVRGIRHQYNQEARLLRPEELGFYAELVTEPSHG
jgi:hypothetical protein